MTGQESRRGTLPISARTLNAYRRTRYETCGIEVRIGRRSRPMDGLLSAYGVREAVFITAYNPYSRIMPAGWNERMQANLTQALRRRKILPATGSWRRWSEAHLVVLGDARPTRRFMRLFRQHAIVIIRRTQPVRLLVAF
jgi:hypothetical protein